MPRDENELQPVSGCVVPIKMRTDYGKGIKHSVQIGYQTFQ